MPRALIVQFLRRLLIVLCAAGWVACGSKADEAPGGHTTDLIISKIHPTSLVPGTRIIIEGNFVDLQPAFLEISGTFGGYNVNVLLPAESKGLGRLEVLWKGGRAMGLPSDEGTFLGLGRVSASIPADPRQHLSPKVPLTLEVAYTLEPKLFGVYEGIVQINDPIRVEGMNFLLGGSEGNSIAILDGCYTKAGDSTCAPIPETIVPVLPDDLTSDAERKVGAFPFLPVIAGIEPGLFQGTVRLRNDHLQSGVSGETESLPVNIQVVAPTLTAFSPPGASLGQFVEISGGGFVGKWSNIDDPTPQATRVAITGTFTPSGAPIGGPVNLELITEFVSGKLVRYVLNEEDALGQAADLRKVTGDFTGTAKPITTYGTTSVSGAEVQVSLAIAPIKQVVWLNFLPTYKDSLEHLGLRAADGPIRKRVVESIQTAYIGVNLEVRLEEPRDFKLYNQVDLEGPDPNGLGLLGYDNSPGKDKGNDRLADKIGGVNAITQEGGYPGYGGVFVDSLLAFSNHPPKFVTKLDDIDPLFDEVFDPLRPDRSGSPVLAEELAQNVPVLTDGHLCPAPKGDRRLRIACAIWVFGSMIGTTTAHEIGHSLGLADPEGEEFHNPGDEINRLMDSGGARTFKERAELKGEGPGVFCDEDYAYLREILPTNVPDPVPSRPTCY